MNIMYVCYVMRSYSLYLFTIRSPSKHGEKGSFDNGYVRYSEVSMKYVFEVFFIHFSKRNISKKR